jgi:hypothetical protein
MATDAEVPAVERQIAFDMIYRSLPAIPVLMILGAIGWGWAGALSAGFAVLIVLANLAASAFIMGWAARRSPAMLMGATLFGYLGRLAVITTVVLLVKDFSWVELVPLGFTIIVTHLGLLAWETRYVSASLAYPALRPRQQKAVRSS